MEIGQSRSPRAGQLDATSGHHAGEDGEHEIVDVDAAEEDETGEALDGFVVC